MSTLDDPINSPRIDAVHTGRVDAIDSSRIDVIAHILDADAHSSRRQNAAALHAAQKDGAFTGGKPDSDQTILAFAANATGMDYRPEVAPDTASLADVNFPVPAKIRNADRRPVPKRCLWDEAIASAPRAQQAVSPKGPRTDPAALPTRPTKTVQDPSTVNRPTWYRLNDSQRRRAEMRAIREAE